jgi:serine/threonine protein kinase
MNFIHISNIFKSGDVLKLGDLGIAKIIETTQNLREMVGTISYMSPELLDNSFYSYNSDVWSAGCVIYETIKLRKIFEGNAFGPIIHAIVKFDENSISFKERHWILENIVKK